MENRYVEDLPRSEIKIYENKFYLVFDKVWIIVLILGYYLALKEPSVELAYFF